MFTIEFHAKVRQDFRGIDPTTCHILYKVIHEKLASNPEQYGKPLSSSLKNLRSLRVGKCRIIYTLKKQRITVLVLKVGKRDDVYDDVLSRLND